MTTIYTPEQTAAILATMEAAALSNQGSADVVSADPAVAAGLRAAGYAVGHGRDLFGAVKLRAMRPAAHAAAAADTAARTAAVRASFDRQPRPDVEARILARNDRHLFA